MEEKLQEMTPAMAVAVGLAIAGFYWFTLYDDGASKVRRIEAAKSENQKLQNEVKKMKKVIREAIEFKVVSEKLGSELDTVLTAIPQDYNSTELMKLLSVEAKTVGLSILSLKATNTTFRNRRRNNSRRGRQKTESDAFYEDFIVDVKFNGTFNQVMQFLSNLTKVNRIIIVKKINMRSAPRTRGAASSVALLEFTAAFEAYRYLVKGEDS